MGMLAGDVLVWNDINYNKVFNLCGVHPAV
jgi:hypothetical protein